MGGFGDEWRGWRDWRVEYLMLMILIRDGDGGLRHGHWGVIYLSLVGLLSSDGCGGGG